MNALTHRLALLKALGRHANPEVSMMVDRISTLRVISGMLSKAQEEAYAARHTVVRRPRPEDPSLHKISAPGVFASRQLGEQRMVELREGTAYHCVLAKAPVSSVQPDAWRPGLLRGWLK